MSNIFDFIEVWEINNSSEHKVSKIVYDKEILDKNLNPIKDNNCEVHLIKPNKKRLLFKFNVRELY